MTLLLGSVVDPGWFGPPGGTAAGLSWVAHLLGYAALAATVRPRFGSGWHGAVAAVLVATGFGAGVELVQLGLPYRTASVADAVLNGVGSVVGAAVRAVVLR